MRLTTGTVSVSRCTPDSRQGWLSRVAFISTKSSRGRKEKTPVIDQAQTDAEQHVEDSQDDGHFHLETVKEDQLVIFC